MAWDGDERRGTHLTVADVKNAVYEANEKFFEKVKEMCDENLETGLLKHTQEFTHFDKATKTIIYEMITNFKNRIKNKYIIGTPLMLLIIERILNKIGLF
jgi:hypothetical protein